MNDKHIQIIGFLVHPKKERVGVEALSHSKKSLLASIAHLPTPTNTTTTTETKEESVAKTTSKNDDSSTNSTKRAPRKTKNPLSIVNDTNNNVITITYDASIDLHEEPNVVKATKATKVSKEPKEPKEPKKSKKSKKESGDAGVAVINE